MTLSIKRSVRIQVNVTDTFKKHYILFINTLITETDQQIDSYKRSAKSLQNDLAFRPYIVNKINESLLKKEQMKQQIDALKKTKVGDTFDFMMLDGHANLVIGDDASSLMSPVTVTVDDSKITDIRY